MSKYNLILIGLALLVSVSYATDKQKGKDKQNQTVVWSVNQYFDDGLTFGSKTKAQLEALTPDTTGQVFYCSDCSNSVNGVVSTGAVVSQFDSFGVAGTAWH